MGGQCPPRQSDAGSQDRCGLRAMAGMLAREKNRLHNRLTDAGIRLGVVVSDWHGHLARAMIKALIAGTSVPEVLRPASNRLCASRQDIFEGLQDLIA